MDTSNEQGPQQPTTGTITRVVRLPETPGAIAFRARAGRIEIFAEGGKYESLPEDVEAMVAERYFRDVRRVG
jgi:hypothetical protein